MLDPAEALPNNRFDTVYRVRPAVPEAHLFEVELTVTSLPPHRLAFFLPAWIPGSYLIRDFARNVVTIAAETADGTPLTLVKRDKQTWELAETKPRLPVIVRWRVFAYDLSVRAAHLDTTHAYFNGSSLLLGVRGLENRPCRIDLEPPEGEGYSDWRVATSLAPLAAPPLGFGSYRADDYADLIDHPVEMGRFSLVTFLVHGVPHTMAITGRHRADEARLTRDLPRVCAQHIALFRELPVHRYLFLVTAAAEGGGGLEHSFSSSLLCARDDLPKPGEDGPSEGYRRFLGLCSHEYFHLWHAKRIRPLAFMEGGLAREVHTRLLWAFEGITSYYDDLALVRAGVIDEHAYLQLLAETITRVMRTPGRLVQTLAEASFDAWTKLYKADENAPNALVSYYSKGALVALALDLTIRRDSRGRLSLDDVMRELWTRYGRTGKGVPEHGIEALAAEVTGLDLHGFFARALDCAQDLDLQALLATLGIVMRLRPCTGPKDLGGCISYFEPHQCGPTLAVRLRPGAAEATLAHVLTGGAGERAGLAPGDTVIAVDGLRANAENLERLVAEAGRDGPVRLHVFRRDELMELTATPKPPVADTCELMPLPSAPEAALRARQAWLASLAPELASHS